MRSGKPITIIQGAQFGSEAKGAITAYVCQTEKVDVCIRTGAVNAGHTVIYGGESVKMQQLPVGWVNPHTQLVIGAGALVHPEVLQAECDMVSHLTGEDIRQRLLIDYRAGVHDSSHTDRSTASGRHHAIGATGKGSSEALIDKIRLRGKGYKTFGMLKDVNDTYQIADTARYLNAAWDQGGKLVIEATQGTLLDINTGPYPYTTHKSTLPGMWLAESGLSPTLPMDLLMVVRTFPIRVAGNSGFMAGETSWPALAREINRKRYEAGRGPIVSDQALFDFEAAIEACAAQSQMKYDKSKKGSNPVIDGFPVPATSNGLDQHQWQDRSKFQVALSELNAMALKRLSRATLDDLSRLFELTTVTKKLRRVAALSMPDLVYASKLCRPTRVALMFMNYEFPQSWYTDDDFTIPANLDAEQQQYVHGIERVCDAPVSHISYGPSSSHVLQRLHS